MRSTETPVPVVGVGLCHKELGPIYERISAIGNKIPSVGESGASARCSGEETCEQRPVCVVSFLQVSGEFLDKHSMMGKLIPLFCRVSKPA